MWGVEQQPHESLAMTLGRALGTIELRDQLSDADMSLVARRRTEIVAAAGVGHPLRHVWRPCVRAVEA